MSDVTDKAQDLIERIESVEKIKIRNEIKHDQIIETLKKKFKVDNEEDALELLKSLKKQRKTNEKKLSKLIEDFDEKYGEELDELGV